MKKKKIIILSIVIAGLLLIATGVTYAFLNINFEGTKVNSLYVPSISLTYSESGNALTIDTRVNNDNEGKALPYFEFSVSGSSEVDYPLDYYIYLTEEESSLTRDQIKFYLTKVENNSETQVLEPTLGSNLKSYGTNEDALFLYKASFDFTETNNTFNDMYRLRGWISHDVLVEVTPDINSSGGTQDITVDSLSYKFKVNVSTTSMDSYCYGFDKSTGTITNYYCYPGNSYGYEAISDIEIPSNIDGVRVVTIGTQAFNAKEITSVIIPETVTTIDTNSFRGNQISSLVIPSSVTSIGSYAFNNNQLPDEEAFIYARKSGGGEDRTTVIGYGGANKDNVIVPDGFLTIGTQAFYSCGISKITLPDGLTTIGNNAFNANNLTELAIPDTVTSIGNGAINSNNFPEETAYLFARKSDGSIDETTLVSYGGKSSKIVTIPSTVKTIKSNSVERLSYADTIIIPEGVEVIENNAFRKGNYYNPSLTTIVNQTGRSFDWGQIINGTSGYSFVSGTVINSYGNVEVVSQ